MRARVARALRAVADVLEFPSSRLRRLSWRISPYVPPAAPTPAPLDANGDGPQVRAAKRDAAITRSYGSSLIVLCGLRRAFPDADPNQLLELSEINSVLEYDEPAAPAAERTQCHN